MSVNSLLTMVRISGTLSASSLEPASLFSLCLRPGQASRATGVVEFSQSGEYIQLQWGKALPRPLLVQPVGVRTVLVVPLVLPGPQVCSIPQEPTATQRMQRRCGCGRLGESNVRSSSRVYGAVFEGVAETRWAFMKGLHNPL